MAGGLYSPSAGDVLTAANALDFWSKQVVIICTSGTRPTAREGMVIYQTDTDTMAMYVTAWCEITPYAASVATSQTTSSTSYTDLATGGPAVTVTTGTKAVITVGFYGALSANNQWMGYAVSSATTIAAADANAATYGVASAVNLQFSYQDYIASLTAGSNVFTSKYRVDAGTKSFANRRIVVVGIPT